MTERKMIIHFAGLAMQALLTRYGMCENEDVVHDDSIPGASGQVPSMRQLSTYSFEQAEAMAREFRLFWEEDTGQ